MTSSSSTRTTATRATRAPDKLGGIPADSPHEYWVRLISDGSQLRAEYSFNGVNYSPVGRNADISGWANPQIGPVALSDQAPSFPVASFDWIRFDPDQPIGGGGGGGGSDTELFADQFDGTALGAGWEVIRGSQALSVSGGALRIPSVMGDLYQGNNTAANLVVRDLPASGAWTATSKINFEGVAQYQQAGIIIRGDDDNYLKLGRIAHTTGGDEKFEFIHEAAAAPDNTAADSTANIAADFPDDYWVQLRSDGTNVTGWYSSNGSDWTQVGRPWGLPANPKVGLFSFGYTAATAAPEAAFDSFRIARPGAPAGPSRDDEFDGSSLDKTRWNAIVRENPGSYSVSGSNLTITTEPGDIYSTDTNPPPNNFILQSADHAGEDWVIETKIDSRVNGGYGQGGLLAYVDGQNYVKLDPIADAGQTRINRIELRTEVNGTPDRSGQRSADRGRHRHRVLAAADEERHELRRRVLARRHDLAAGRDGRQRDAPTRRSASSPSGRRPTARATRWRSTTSCSTAVTPASRATASRARATSSTAARWTRRSGTRSSASRRASTRSTTASSASRRSPATSTPTPIRRRRGTSSSSRRTTRALTG